MKPISKEKHILNNHTISIFFDTITVSTPFRSNHFLSNVPVILVNFLDMDLNFQIKMTSIKNLNLCVSYAVVYLCVASANVISTRKKIGYLESACKLP